MDFLKRAVEYMAEGHSLDGNAEARREFLGAFDARYHDVTKVAFNRHAGRRSKYRLIPPLCLLKLLPSPSEYTPGAGSLFVLSLVAVVGIPGRFLLVKISPFNERDTQLHCLLTKAFKRFQKCYPELRPRAFDLTIAIFDRGTDVEHWGLVLGDKFLHGKNEFVNKKLKETLTPNVQDWNLYSSSPRVTRIPLGQARFNHQSDKLNAVNDALALQMPAPYLAKGGGCMDFITLVLDQLKRKDQCGEDVVQRYREEYVANYHEVSKLVWDVDLQP
ncbi:hypothetical protein EV359DRAFT_86778 [Lentinula novae-zelandiae]|nr:hypothetical protein EV359DRAFT_86778 [Lentinula novae-zelandiae]